MKLLPWVTWPSLFTRKTWPLLPVVWTPVQNVWNVQPLKFFFRSYGQWWRIVIVSIFNYFLYSDIIAIKIILLMIAEPNIDERKFAHQISLTGTVTDWRVTGSIDIQVKCLHEHFSARNVAVYVSYSLVYRITYYFFQKKIRFSLSVCRPGATGGRWGASPTQLESTPPYLKSKFPASSIERVKK